MNIQRSNKTNIKVPKPSNFVEATVALATCYKNALTAGVDGDDDKIRLWVDASRSIKAFFKRYQETANKEQLIADLEKTGGKQILAESLKELKQALPFIETWASRFSSLQVRDFVDFHEIHWDIFIDEVVPLTWDWESDLFIIRHSEKKIVETLVARGQKRILIIEPNKSQRKKLTKHIKTLDSHSLYVLRSKEEIKSYVSSWIDNPPYLSRVISSAAALDEDQNSDTSEIQDLAREGMINAITFDVTIKSHDQTWIKNGLDNFENLVKYPNILCLKNKFRNSSAIIVSPGPSLEKNVHLLEKAKGKAIIVAVSHSLEFLKSRGIVPDVVIHVDPNVNIERYFDGFPFEDVELLVLSATTAPNLFNLPTKNKAWLFANAYFDNWLMQLIDVEDYTLWGSCVSVAALRLTYTWGCKNVALIGQDLSFKTGEYYAGGSYAPESVIESFEESLKEEIYKLPGYYGGEVVTKNDYRIYHGQFLDLAKGLKKNSQIKLYNCTEGGANIEGFENCSLESFISEVITKNIKKTNNSFEKDILKFLVDDTNKVKVRNNIIKTKRHLTEAQRLLQAALLKTDVLDENNIDTSALAAIQKKAAKKLKGSMFLKIALQDALYDISTDEGYEHNQRGYLKKVTEMYKACLQVIKRLRGELDKLNLR